HIPLNETRPVDNVTDVLAGNLPGRFVIKPNDGFANRDVGFFRSNAPDLRAQLERYFAGAGSSSFILEDFLEGTEYAVNGQMDAAGRAQVVNVIEYERVAANGKPNVYHRTHH